MLYLSFRFTLLFVSAIGLLHMVGEGNYTYLFFPVVMLLWVFYTFFDEDDSEYRRRNGDFYIPKNDDWNEPLYLGDTDSYFYSNYSHGNDNNNNGKTYHYVASKPKEYKNIVKRCKRTCKITLEKDNKNEND